MFIQQVANIDKNGIFLSHLFYFQHDLYFNKIIVIFQFTETM
jgi:hypothetical protein